jgi:hypothetical protein
MALSRGPQGLLFLKAVIRIASLEVAIGLKARRQGSPREGPECALKRPFHCERETGFIAQSS